MGQAFEILKNDIKRLWLPLIIIAVYFIVMLAIFGEVCPMLIATHFPCPACGLTRAAFSLMKLDPGAAWTYNPAIYLWIPLLIFMLILHFRGKKSKLTIPLAIFTALATIVIYILRIAGHIPGSPLHVLYSAYQTML